MIRQIFAKPSEGGSTPRREVVMVEEQLSPEELAAFHAQGERFERNSDWLDAHASEVYAQHRGKYICVAACELFVADTPLEAIALARAAHPEDDGRLLRYIPKEKRICIYAH